jgi:hypothetical protein
LPFFSGFGHGCDRKEQILLFASTTVDPIMAPLENAQPDGISDSSSTSDPLDTRDDEGWEDLENDEEPMTVQSLFDEKTFSNAQDMLAYCRDAKAFDIWSLRQEFGKSCCPPESKLSLM